MCFFKCCLYVERYSNEYNYKFKGFFFFWQITPDSYNPYKHDFMKEG